METKRMIQSVVLHRDCPFLHVMQEYYQLPELINVSEDADLASVLQEKRFGFELWKILVAMALFVLIIETLFLRERKILDV